MQAPWFAIAFALYPLLFIAATNPGQVAGGTLVIVLIAAAIVSSMLLLALRFLLGNGLRAGLGVVWFLVLFFSYGPLNAWYAGRGGNPDAELLATGWVDQHLQLVHSAVWLLLLAFGWLWLRRLDRPLGRLPAALNLVSALLLGFVLVQWFTAVGREQGVALRISTASIAAANEPDIYFILLDGYARADVLTRYYSFDNGPFIRGLEQRGFQVGDASEANYNWTFLSLASTLNMNYLSDLLAGKLDPNGIDRDQTYQLLRDNDAAAFLRTRGYRFVHLQSTWGGTGSNPYADDFIPCGGGMFRDEYLLAVAEVSWLRAFGSNASMDLAACHLRNFENLQGLAGEPGPKFVFAHFVPPHHPYLFDREGRVLRNANLSNQFEFQKRLWEERGAYLEQLIFVNRSIERVIDKLIADSTRSPVILLLSDHGPNIRRGLAIDEHYRVRLANFSAVRLPDAAPDLVPEDVSNVNLLRIVFDYLFDAGLPLLPDRCFVSAFGRPFDFKEVDKNGARVEAVAGPADNM